MYSLFVYSYNSIKTTTSVILLSVLLGCSHQKIFTVDVFPKHFRVQTPFILNDRGIIINTYWGNDRKHHVLCLDNYSPSWIKSSAIQYGQSFTKARNLFFKTTAADSSFIQGDIGICKSISFSNVVFSNVPFYLMPDNAMDNKTDDGVLGIDAMKKGIWKIDFKKEELTFASDIDSFELSQAEIFPATFYE